MLVTAWVIWVLLCNLINSGGFVFHPFELVIFFFFWAFPSYISEVHHFLGEIFCVCDRFLIQPLR